jgi:DNA-directed RNA polymerase subunit RPC12/RpoP
VTVAYGSGGIWTGRRDAANRESEIRPGAFQGPVPAHLRGAASGVTRSFLEHEKGAARNAMRAPRKHVGSRGFPTREEKEAARKREELARQPPASPPGEPPLHPPCQACGGRTRLNGHYDSGEIRYRCTGCGKISGRASRVAKPPGPPCPYCGGPSYAKGRSALGVPIRRCKAPRTVCGKHWTTIKKRTKAYNGFSSTRSASAKAAWARKTEEERRDIGKRAAAARLASQSPESRSAGARTREARTAPGERVARARKAAAALHSLPEADRLARIAKVQETKRLKREAALAWLAAQEGGE